MRQLTIEGVILSPSSMRQLSMIGKINAPFKMVQVIFKKNLSMDVNNLFRDKCDESGSKLVYVSREYDGSERFMLLYPQGFSYDFFPQDKNLLFLV